jgi:DNA primase RepB-like protein
MTSASSTPDRAEAEHFLALLDSTTARFTFQTFDDNKERLTANKLKRAEVNERRKAKGLKPLTGSPDPFARVFNGTLDMYWGELVRLNKEGAGIFITVNATDFKGRKAENVIRVRCLFLDLDGAPVPTNCPVPHIVTETSPGHWHVYWRVDGIALDEFADKQRALIAAHGGDPVVCDLPRVMRLPGFFHQKGEASMVRIVTASRASPYGPFDFATMKTAFGQSALRARDQRVVRIPLPVGRTARNAATAWIATADRPRL